MLRYTSPVANFQRTVMQDTTLRGVPLSAGDRVVVFYGSANRDEDVFADPFTFDVGRTPNKHLAFGFGVHYCLGAMLARMEMKALFNAIIPRLKSVELAGEPEPTVRSGWDVSTPRVSIGAAGPSPTLNAVNRTTARRR